LDISKRRVAKRRKKYKLPQKVKRNEEAADDRNNNRNNAKLGKRIRANADSIESNATSFEPDMRVREANNSAELSGERGRGRLERRIQAALAQQVGRAKAV
jgi:hypothetical protein